MSVDYASFAAVLRDLGVPGQVCELPESAPTAATAAAQLGCEVGAIANSLIFSADGAPLLVMTSGAHRVDVVQVAALVGAVSVRRADARSVREWTGQAIGGVAPVGHPAPIRTLVDTWLDKYDVVWAAAGHPHTVFPTSFGADPDHRRRARRRGRLVFGLLPVPAGAVVREWPVVRQGSGCAGPRAACLGFRVDGAVVPALTQCREYKKPPSAWAV